MDQPRLPRLSALLQHSHLEKKLAKLGDGLITFKQMIIFVMAGKLIQIPRHFVLTSEVRARENIFRGKLMFFLHGEGNFLSRISFPTEIV